MMDLNLSIGENLFNSLKNHPQNFVIQVDGLTGESHTVREGLESYVAAATGMRRLGLQVEDVVAIISNYSNNSIIATIATFLQGAAPFPMDPTMKQLELEHMFKLSQPKLVFVYSDKAKEALNALNAIGNNALIYLLDENTKYDKNDRIRPFNEILAFNVAVESFKCTHVERLNEQVAAVIPSSGTTGLPKGVATSHKAYMLQFDAFERVLPEGDRSCLQLTHLFWISGFQMLLLSCLNGYRRVYLNDHRPEIILKAMERYKPCWSVMAPIYVAALVSYPDIDKYDISSFKEIAAGGAVLPHSTIKLFLKNLPSIQLSQAYGASEVGGIITIPFDKTNIYSVGKPLPMHSTKIVDVNTNEELDRYKEGEIVIKTPSIMLRYMWSEKDVPNPIDSDGYYHTGDLGHMDDKGYLFITGRIKELIKVKNNQVAPAELEGVISYLPGVIDVAVVGVPHAIDQYHPRALVIKEPGSALTERDIVEEVAAKLSETKQLFAGVQFVNSLPRNTNGKLLRGELSKLVKL